MRGFAFMLIGVLMLLFWAWLLGGVGVAIGVIAMIGSFIEGYCGRRLSDIGGPRPAPQLTANATGAVVAATAAPTRRRSGWWWTAPASLVVGLFAFVIVVAIMAPDKPKESSTVAAEQTIATPPKHAEPRPAPPPVESSAVRTATLDALAIGCRTSALLDSVVDAFGKGDGPDGLNALVRSKDCRWLPAGTRYSLTNTRANELSREIRLTDDQSTAWVLLKSLSPREVADAASAGDGLTFDEPTFLSMATMQAALDYAKANCAGSVDPSAEGAVAVVARQDPAKMKAAIAYARAAVETQGEKVGVARQCRNIVDAFGPNGSLNRGAWRPRQQ